MSKSEIINSNGSGHGALAGLLKMFGVEVLICGGIGGGAQTALANAGIKLFGVVHGEADKAVETYLSGKLEFNPNVECNHHENIMVKVIIAANIAVAEIAEIIKL